MPVTTGQVRKAVKRGLFEPDRLYVSDLQGGQFDGTQLSADDSGVVGYVEIGNHDPFADSVAVLVGQFLGERPEVPPAVEEANDGDKFLAGNTSQARADIDLNEAADDANKSAKWWLAGAKDETEKKPRLTGVIRNQLMDTSYTAGITEHEPITPGSGRLSPVGDGEYVNWVADPGAGGAETYSLSDSSGFWPVLTWDGSGL